VAETSTLLVPKIANAAEAAMATASSNANSCLAWPVGGWAGPD